MTYKGIFILLSIFSIIYPIFGSNIIKLEVAPKLLIELMDIKYEKNVKNSFQNVSFYISNPGNIPYEAVARLDIYKEATAIFTGWSEKFQINMGDTKHINLYWYPKNISGDFKARIRVYYATEIIDDATINFKLENSENVENSINLINLETYKEELVLKIYSKKPLGEIIVVPSEFPDGWRISQKKAKIDGGFSKIYMQYQPSIWQEGKSVVFNVFNTDGKFLGSEKFFMKKEHIIKIFIYETTSKIKSLIQNL